MLSFVLGNGLHVLDKHLKTSGANDPFMGLNIGYQGLEASLPSQVKFGGAITADGACQDVARGALALYGADQVDQAQKLLALISSKDNFAKALKVIVREHFADANWEPNYF
jgi:hypothetical protein